MLLAEMQEPGRGVGRKLQVVRPMAVLAVTVSHRTNSGQGCNVSGQICYLSGHK